MKRLFYLLSIVLLISACREPFDFEYPEVSERAVVIEGYLTNEAGQHRIRVSEGTRLGEFNGIEPRYVTNADVRIEDDQGLVYVLSHRTKGEYYTDQTAVAVEGRSYKVIVELADGRIFASQSEVLPTGNVQPINLQYQLGEREIEVNGTLQKERALVLENTIYKESTDKFYMWEINEFFIKEADAGPATSLEDELGIRDNQPLRYCYVRDFPIQEIYVHKDIANEQFNGSEYQRFLEYVSIDSRWEYDYILMVKQLMLDVDAFDYWEQISQFSQNSGSLFDPFPARVIGNIKEQNGAEEALGYFGVYKSSFFRKKITYQELGVNDLVFYPCTPPQRPGPHPCLDCKLYSYPDNFYNNKPDWWE